MIDAKTFVEDYPEFAAQKQFPVSMIAYWLNAAALFINQDRWGLPGAGGKDPRTEFDLGQELYAAHQLVLEGQAIANASNGGIPGLSFGIINNKSVDKVSIGYDTGSAAELNAGHWNLTIYGQRFIRLARMFGAGPVQVGLGSCPPPFSGPAWSGPWTSQFPNASQ